MFPIDNTFIIERLYNIYCNFLIYYQITFIECYYLWIDKSKFWLFQADWNVVVAMAIWS